MLIPYGIQSYKRSDLPQIKLTNLYAETTPTSEATTALLPRPGLTSYASLGAGPIRGLFQQPGSVGAALFAVSGTSLYRNGTAIGTVTGSQRVATAGTLNTLLIATEGSFFSSDGSTVTTIAFPDGAAVSDVAVLGDYAFALRAGSRHIHFTLDVGTWDALDYVSTEASTANGVGMQVVGDQLWVFTENATEIFVLTGNADAPIQAVQGRVFNKGALSRDTIVGMDNTAFWVGHDGIVYRGENQPVRVSDYGIEERIAASTSVDAWTYTWFGHVFYVLNTAQGTFAFDAATKQWHELASYGQPNWRAYRGISVGRTVLAGDITNGTIWQLTEGRFDDAGSPMERWFSAYLTQPEFVDNLLVDCSGGNTGSPSGSPGTIEMRTSRDGGQTFANWRQASMGANGKTRSRVVFHRLGMVDSGNMLIQFRTTDPRASRISYIRINESVAGLAV